MQVAKRISSLFIEVHKPLLTQIRGLKIITPPKKRESIEFPSETRLRLVEKVPTYHQGHWKTQKKLRLMRGPEEFHDYLIHKQFGVIAESGGRLKHCHFEVMRHTMNRKMNKETMFAVYRVDPPWFPVTRKSQGQRMGGGKGSIHHYCTPVKAGRVIIEVGGDCEFYEIKHALEIIANLMPFKARVVTHESLEKARKEQKFLEEDNANPYTWKYIIQNNIWGCQKWIKPNDFKYFAKYV